MGRFWSWGSGYQVSDKSSDADIQFLESKATFSFGETWSPVRSMRLSQLPVFKTIGSFKKVTNLYLT